MTNQFRINNIQSLIVELGYPVYQSFYDRNVIENHKIYQIFYDFDLEWNAYPINKNKDAINSITLVYFRNNN